MKEHIFDNNAGTNNIFPRELYAIEKELLFSVLPEGKPGYKIYRDKIDNLLVAGAGRFGRGNLYLGKEGAAPDNTLPSAPVLASGTVEFIECTADINIHEEVDEVIEFDIAFSTEEIPALLHEKKRWSYSDWIPGQKAPFDGSDVREISAGDGLHFLAIAPAHKKIWLHEIRSGINFLIPVSNLYNSLMLMKNIREANTVSKPALFFENQKNFTDREIISAFLVYNKYFRKFNINSSGFEDKPVKSKKKSIFKIFRKG